MLLMTFQCHSEWVLSLSFSISGNILASGGGDSLVNIFSIEDRREIKTIKTHNGYVKAVQFSEDGKTFVTASTDCSVNVWSLS